MDDKRISRRQLLRDAAGVAAAASVGAIAGCLPDVGGTWPSVSQALECTSAEGGADDAGPVTTVSKVVEAYREDSVLLSADGETATIQADKVQLMVDAALSALAGSIDNPWKVLLPDYSEGMRIGLKVNCLSRGTPTSPAVISALITSLKTHLKIAPTNVIVWDRRSDELNRNVGYTTEAFGGAQILGTWTSPDDPTGPGYEDGACGTFAGEDGSLPRLSRILTERTDMTINCAVLKRHISGVTGAMKNIYGIIHNPLWYHHELLQTAIPALYAQPPIRKSLRLVVMDCLRAVIDGSGESSPDDTPRKILVGQDPVALDSRALDVLNEQRAKMGLDPIPPSLTRWLDNAYQAGLGSRTYDLVSL
jgi:uncharacterized protein (DUF362 family)